jgi:DNA-binding transcriptional ArsR family regulator
MRVMSGIDCIAVLRAMGEPTRARIVRLLLKENLSVNDIARRVQATQYNVSKHLRILREAGLLVAEKRGKTHFYSVTSQFKARMEEGADVLKLDCCTFRFDKFP